MKNPLSVTAAVFIGCSQRLIELSISGPTTQICCSFMKLEHKPHYDIEMTTWHREEH